MSELDGLHGSNVRCAHGVLRDDVCPECNAYYQAEIDQENTMHVSGGLVRTWDPEDPDIDAADYIIGSVLGWWRKDDDSLAAATVATLSQVLHCAGLDAAAAVDKAIDTVFPEEGDERTLGISVEKIDGKYEVKFDFAGSEAS